MLEINTQWTNYKTHCPKGDIQFNSDLDAIQSHLFLVCDALVQRTPINLDTEQKRNRIHLISVFRQYAKEKRFPTNLYHNIRTPYFVDDSGVHCAVGYLMHHSGYESLVTEISKNENYKYIEEIKTKGVYEWALTHGFTLDELKWIQPAYSPPPAQLSAVGNGTNGPIMKMTQNYWSGGVYVAGDFDTLDLIPCENIGIYKDNQFSCLGNGLKGEILDVRMKSGNLYVCGALEHENTIYPLAIWNNEVWQFIEIPGREGAKATAGFFSSADHLVINHPEDQNKQEIWYRQGSNGSWIKELEIEGYMTSIESSVHGQIFAGAFSSVYTVGTNGEYNDTLSCNNILFRKQTSNPVWEPILDDAIPDTIKCVYILQQQIYFGGTAIKNEANSSGVVLSRFLNNTFQPVLLTNNFSNDTVSINAIVLSTEATSLLIGGRFDYYPGNGTFGKNLAHYDFIYHQIFPKAFLDDEVKTIRYLHENAILIGGKFSNNLNDYQLNHLARFGSHLGVEEIEKPSVSVYPNPFSNYLTISGLQSISPYKIVDNLGRVIQTGNLQNEDTMNLESLLPGIYRIQIEHPKGLISQQIIKN